MRSKLLLAAAIGGILLGAFALERQLTSVEDVAVVPPEVRPSASPVPAPAPVVLPSPPPPPVEVVQAPPPRSTLIPPPPSANQEPDLSDYDGAFTADHSREVEYAFQLAIGPASTVETAKNAAEVFERCIKQFPRNARCYQGLQAAQQRQSPDWKPPRPAQSLAAQQGSPMRGEPPGTGEPKFKLLRRTAPAR